MDEILNYNLIEWGKYAFSVADLVLILIIIISSKLAMLLVRKVVSRKFRNENDKDGRKFALVKLISYIIWTIAIILMIQTTGIKVTLLLAGSAALLVGVGLGLQQTFNDFISGFILLVDGTIELNDVIEVDNMMARVEHIGARTSVLVTRGDIAVIVPNSKLTGNNVINWSHIKKQSRFQINIGVAYDSDEELVKKVLLECAARNTHIMQQPAPFVRLEEFADSSINFSLYFWTSEIFSVENIKSDLRFLIAKRFKENNISIPFPQLDVYVKKFPGNKS
ncbi:MAG: mechanosensitive ion channel [Niastella sp.]|nr:mechanosensitive ion channel [Niastella sp.]